MKLAGGDPSDALVIDADVIYSGAAKDSGELAEGFKSAMGWDPREMDGWMLFRLRPTRIQAFRGYDEIENRDVMVRSRWLVEGIGKPRESMGAVSRRLRSEQFVLRRASIVGIVLFIPDIVCRL